jgi:hypothetical protein
MLQENLIQELLIAKIKESQAKEYRISIEKKLIEESSLDDSKFEGTESFKTDKYKISFIKKLSYKIDKEELDKWPLHQTGEFIDHKPVINITKLRTYQSINKECVDAVVTTTPLKTQIIVKEL